MWVRGAGVMYLMRCTGEPPAAAAWISATKRFNRPVLTLQGGMGLRRAGGRPPRDLPVQGMDGRDKGGGGEVLPCIFCSAHFFPLPPPSSLPPTSCSTPRTPS